MTNQEMYEYAVLKWQYIVSHNGSDNELKKEHPELRNFISGCSYCGEFVYDGCVDCPLNLSGFNYKSSISQPGNACQESNHPFNIWNHSRTKENAHAVLDLIIKTKPEI